MFAVLERFCRVFGSMTRAGVSLPEAIQAAADSTNNTVYEATLLEVQERMLGRRRYRRTDREQRPFPAYRRTAPPRRRSDGFARSPARERGQLLQRAADLQAQEAHDPHRTRGRDLHGSHRRVRRARARLRDVRHLPRPGPGAPVMTMAAVAEPRSQDGFTLVEVMVTVMIMSIAFVTILEGEAVFFHSTTIRRATAVARHRDPELRHGLGQRRRTPTAPLRTRRRPTRERPPRSRSTTGPATPRRRRSRIEPRALRTATKARSA